MSLQSVEDAQLQRAIEESFALSLAGSQGPTPPTDLA